MSETPITILVVDDDLFTAELTGLTLESSGFSALIAEGGIDALEKLASDPSIQVVVSDLNMPFMDGLQLFAELREQGFKQPFVLLSGQETPPHEGVSAMVTKDEHLQERLPSLIGDLVKTNPGLAQRGSAPTLEPSLASQAGSTIPERLPGLDLQQALKGLNGNWGTLRELLLAFRGEYQDAPGAYRALFAAGDRQACLAGLHTLKGSAGMLAATRLPKAITALEAEIAASGQDPSHWNEFESALDELSQGFSGI